MKKLFTLLFFAILGLNNMNSATFSSVASGTWSAPATWNVTGVDADGIPDADDDVTINGGHTVDLVGSSYCKTLLIQSTGVMDGNAKALAVKGDFTIFGTVTGNFNFYSQANCILSSTNAISNTGDWYVQGGTLTIAATTTISNSGYLTVNSGCSVNNLGTFILNGGSPKLLGVGLQWTNGVNSILSVGANITGSGTFDISAIPNTVKYTGNGLVTQIKNLNYYNLELNSSYTKTVSADLVVLNDFTMNSISSNKLNLNNFNMTVGGNWTNNAGTTILNQGTITFNGSGTQTISRAIWNESINNMIINGSGTVLLGKNIDIPQSLTINSGTFDLSASNYSVNISGNLINNGSINTRSALFKFGGSTAQSISGSSNTQFYNLTLNNAAGLTINSAQSLKNILTVTAGNFNSNDNFTLISDGTSTGITGQVGTSGSFSGNMTIQKHISARTANYHDLSSPVSNSTIMDWDDDLFMSGIGPDDGTPGYAGVDGSAQGDTTAWTYKESNASWTAVTGSTTPLVVGKGYEIYIADDLTSWAARTIDTKGTPNYGSKQVNLSYTAGAGAYAGVNLVGNPYAASVNYSLCPKTNITGNILLLDNSGNYNDYGTSPVIPPHQGFWVTASAAGAKLTFIEFAKSTTTVTNFFRTSPNYGIKLVFSSPSLPYYNENTINFESNSTVGYDLELDALYIKSPNKTAPAIYMLTDTDAKLITNNIDTKEEEIAIPLAIFTPKEGVYYIEPTVLNTHSYNYSWIENTKTGKKHELNSSITIIGEENNTNTDYVLRLSKNSSESDVNQSVFDNDIIIFGTENDINLKSINTTHYISQVAVYDISGKLLIEQNNLTVGSGETNKIDISSLSTGVYIVSVTDILGHIKTQKIIR